MEYFCTIRIMGLWFFSVDIDDSWTHESAQNLSACSLSPNFISKLLDYANQTRHLQYFLDEIFLSSSICYSEERLKEFNCIVRPVWYPSRFGFPLITKHQRNVRFVTFQSLVAEVAEISIGSAQYKIILKIMWMKTPTEINRSFHLQMQIYRWMSEIKRAIGYATRTRGCITWQSIINSVSFSLSIQCTLSMITKLERIHQEWQTWTMHISSLVIPKYHTHCK